MITTSVLIPFLFVIVMVLFEAIVIKLNFVERMHNVAWDLCVLSLGISGGIFSDSHLINAYTAQGSHSRAIISIAVTLIIVGVIGHLRKSHSIRDKKSWKGFLSVGLGAFALSIPAYYVFPL